MPLQTMNYRGTEVWLEDNHGRHLPLSEDPQIDEDLQTVSASVRLDPKTSFTLVWRRETRAEPMSALCHVFISGGYLTPNIPNFSLATVAMDKDKRQTQRRTTYRHQNAPYKRKSYLRTGRKCDLPKRKVQHAVGCNIRLEIRRIRGHVHQPQWVMGPDDQEVRETNAHKMNIIDDENMDMLPFSTFLFHFPEVDVDQSGHKIGGGDNVSKGSTIGINKMPVLKNPTSNFSSGQQPNFGGRDNCPEQRRISDDGRAISPPDNNETVYVNTHPGPSQRVTVPHSRPKKTFRKVEVVIDVPPPVVPSMVIDIPPLSPSTRERRSRSKTQEEDDPIKIEKIEQEEHVEQKPSHGGAGDPSQFELTEDYLALDKIEKELKRKLKEKIKAKQNNIHYLRRLLQESD